MNAVPPKPGQRPRRAASARADRWTEEEVALLGTIPDEEVAAQTGRTKVAVYLKRRQLGIAQCPLSDTSGPRWTEEEVALLGTAPDAEIALRIGRTKTAVYVYAVYTIWAGCLMVVCSTRCDWCPAKLSLPFSRSRRANRKVCHIC
jgi:hypothetical protein